LLAVVRVDSALGHSDQPLLPRLSLQLGDLIGIAPDGRLGTARHSMLGYHSTIVKNEISPHKSPPHVLDDGTLQTA
jgi:hypothetical protein